MNKNTGVELNIERKTPQYKKVTEQDRRLAKHLQKVRQEKGFTQEQLAEKIKVSATWIGYIEAGYRLPNLKLLYKIARELNVKVAELFPF